MGGIDVPSVDLCRIILVRPDGWKTGLILFCTKVKPQHARHVDTCVAWFWALRYILCMGTIPFCSCNRQERQQVISTELSVRFSSLYLVLVAKGQPVEFVESARLLRKDNHCPSLLRVWGYKIHIFINDFFPFFSYNNQF